MRRLVIAALAAAVCSQIPAAGQPTLRKQVSDSTAPQPMSTSELTELGDPMFLLVLRDRPQETRLDEVEKLILGPGGQRSLFVVDERIHDPARGGNRRAVTAFSGTNQGVRLDPNIVLSTAFDDQRFSPGFIEVWGWDDSRSRYNYYKLDGNPPTWKFRGSSNGADQLTATQRAGTCMACHINGGPLMKELPFPWNNWHSFRNPIPYLSASGADHWQVAESPRFRDLKGAESLETAFILPSIRQFNGRRLSAAIRQVDSADHEALDGSRLLRPLFRSTEYNIISAGQFSGLHPLPKVGPGPSEAISVPDTFFLNANLLAGGGITQYEGLAVPEARQFANLLQIQPAEYQTLVAQAKTTVGGLPGDASFAWFVPEPSHVDNHMIDLLIRRGVITREFAAAVMSVDLEAPVFSSTRATLLGTIPAQFRFHQLAPGDVPAAHPDRLTQAVIANVKASVPVAGSAQADFLALLQNPNPIALLRARVIAYQQRVRSRLADAQQRRLELERLYRLMLQRRKDAERLVPALVESPFLFPGGTP